MKSEKILKMLPKLESLNENKISLIENAVNSCLIVQALEEEINPTLLMNELEKNHKKKQI